MKAIAKSLFVLLPLTALLFASTTLASPSEQRACARWAYNKGYSRNNSIKMCRGVNFGCAKWAWERGASVSSATYYCRGHVNARCAKWEYWTGRSVLDSIYRCTDYYWL